MEPTLTLDAHPQHGRQKHHYSIASCNNVCVCVCACVLMHECTCASERIFINEKSIKTQHKYVRIIKGIELHFNHICMYIPLDVHVFLN